MCAAGTFETLVVGIPGREFGMSSNLTERQRKDLHEAIYDYLLTDSLGLSKVAEVFKQEALGGVSALTSSSGKCLLEKKWTSVVRLTAYMINHLSFVHFVSPPFILTSRIHPFILQTPRQFETRYTIQRLQRRVIELESQLEASKASAVFRPGAGLENADEGGSRFRGLPKGPFKNTLSGHRGPITSISIHPVYSIVASASEDATIKIWDYETAQYERTLKGHTQAVTCVSFDSSGKLLVSCSLDLSAKIWDLSNYTCSKTLRGHDHTISGAKFLPSSDAVVTCSRDNTLKLWEVATGFCTRTYNGHSDWVRCVSVSLDGLYMAGGSSDQTISIWNISSGKQIQTLRGHEHVVECVAYGRRPVVEKIIAGVKNSDVGSSSSSVGNENDADGKIISSEADYGYLASGSRDRTVKLWDALNGVCLMTYTSHENWVRSVLLHPSGKYIVSASDDKTIRVFDVKEEKCLRTIADAHNHFVTDIATNSRSNAYVSCSVDKTLATWQVN